MADLLVSAVAKTILGILSSASVQEIGLVWGLKDELDNLESTFTTLHLVLLDAEIEQRKSDPLQKWVRKLKDAASDAENRLDQMATEGLRRRMDSERGKSCLSCRNALLFLFKMAHKIKSVSGKLGAMAEERRKFHLTEGVVENRFGVTLERRKTSSVENELEICRREKEKETILEKLLDNTRNQDDVSFLQYGVWVELGITSDYNNKRI